MHYNNDNYQFTTTTTNMKRVKHYMDVALTAGRFYATMNLNKNDALCNVGDSTDIDLQTLQSSIQIIAKNKDRVTMEVEKCFPKT